MCLGVNTVLDLALESGHCYLYSRSVLELLEPWDIECQSSWV